MANIANQFYNDILNYLSILGVYSYLRGQVNIHFTKLLCGPSSNHVKPGGQ